MSDVWLNSWDVEFRDVVIVDQNNVRVGVYNVTVNDLGVAENYDTLRQMFIDTALPPEEPELAAGDANRDYQFDQRDLLLVLQGGKYQIGESATWDEGDWNSDGVFDQRDMVAALQTGNFLQGPYAAMAPSDDVGSADTSSIADRASAADRLFEQASEAGDLLTDDTF